MGLGASTSEVPNPPENILVEKVTSSSNTLNWDAPASPEPKYYVVWSQNRKTVQEMETETYTVEDLTPGIEDSFQIVTLLKTPCRSNPAEIASQTQSQIECFLQDLGLQQHSKAKLSLSSVLQIDQRTVTDNPAQSLLDLPWLFLKKLIMMNTTARNVDFVEPLDEYEELSPLNLDLNQGPSNKVNPLDIVTALFLCSDSFLQQEIALKMSMCQFSVPLLLPHYDEHQITLMAWALRDIVKKFRPHSLSDEKSFVEERIVLCDIPLVSFVRFGNCTISKSEILNKMLSNQQQCHNTFINYNMKCGDIPPKISNGLVEISWYLPCGNQNIDKFPEAVAFANLRGDINMFEIQYSFLCEISTAVFVFFDDLDSDYQLLTRKNGKAQFFLVGNAQSQAFNIDALSKTVTEMNLEKRNIILKKKPSDAEFVSHLCSLVTDVVKNSNVMVNLEKMKEVAHELGILIDEDSEEIQNAKRNAEAITNKIQDTAMFKTNQLPLQGEICKQLAKLEKEECRLQRAGKKNIEQYVSVLTDEKKKLRKKQNSFEMSVAMTCFITALSNSGKLERFYFLKWMRMNLDNLSCKKLSALREEYKEKSLKSSVNKKLLEALDKEISNSSLGIEHFLREMGQLYEAAVALPENSQSRLQMQHLPELCAQLLLDGFPLELMDGDASNIPLRWVSDVLNRLNTLVKDKNRIKVVTVLGVQSTGKSTLLNTMFGVQFAVSSGHCTRGAFVLLIKISESFREEVKCDYLLIIDTEGLKSPELSQLAESYEHDNELATLVVGLSDITIINTAMENYTEMKDILQIVVHAFLRMKQIGKKPKCMFVHQNVADVSAHDKNMSDRKNLLKQLNEMTQAAAKMENTEKFEKFTDVIEYDSETGNWYIPGLWQGDPPMAAVSNGYSETVYNFKKNMIESLLKSKNKSTNSIPDFLEWVRSLWTAVKHENFIFSFRNSLVADAYMKLCTEFHKWEWFFKKDMYAWSTNAERRISNFEIIKSESNLQDLEQKLKLEAITKLSDWEKTILRNLAEYFEQTEGNVNLVERYKSEFEISAKSLRKEIEISVTKEVELLIEIRTAKSKLDNITKTYTDKMEREVRCLLEDIRKNRSSGSMSEEQLNKVFDEMWQKTVKELPFKRLERLNIYDIVTGQLRLNMSKRGSAVSEQLNKVTLDKQNIKDFKVNPDGFVEDIENIFHKTELIVKQQELADRIIEACRQSINKKKEKKLDYHDTYVQDILHVVDEKLASDIKLKVSDELELSLKEYICAYAAKEFQVMHASFIQENDPWHCLQKYKNKFCAEFKNVFNNQDQCQRKAEEFTEQCLIPAVRTNICNKLGLEITDTMLQGETASQFSTRTFFQYSILEQLLEEDKFEHYVSYIQSYEEFVKIWILKEIEKKFSREKRLLELEQNLLKKAIVEINDAISRTQSNMKEKENIKEFIQDICRELGETLVLPNDCLEAVVVLKSANQEQFAHWLKQFVSDMEGSLVAEFKQENMQEKLSKLKIKPQDELFKRLIGCGTQCPFCEAPCESGGEAHTRHSASKHRSRGLGSRRYEKSERLVTDICSTGVHSKASFRCLETEYKYHPYKKYREIFPDWDIPADSSIEASMYWKYVFMHFNKHFAAWYKAEPADIPPAWKYITKEQAKHSLQQSFCIR